MSYDDVVRSLMAPASTPLASTEYVLVENEEARFRRRVDFFRALCPAELRDIPYYHVAGTNGESICVRGLVQRPISPVSASEILAGFLSHVTLNVI